jgi:hypothetical protein
MVITYSPEADLAGRLKDILKITGLHNLHRTLRLRSDYNIKMDVKDTR